MLKAKTTSYRNNLPYSLFVTKWYMCLYYHTTHYALKPVLHDYLPVESSAETKFIDFKITPD